MRRSCSGPYYSGVVALACNLGAIGESQRSRYDDLVKRLRAALQSSAELSPAELPDGYSYRLDTAKITPPEVAEWMAMERLCCPFLSIQMEVVGNDASVTMRGPDGVKALLREEFPSG
jgi:hypothetical protein